MIRTNANLIVCFSDLHAGSSVGLLPLDFVNHEGNEIKQNEVQKWLWECWEDAWEWAFDLIGEEKWAAVANGDLCDGWHHHTKQLVSIDESDHMKAAYLLLVDKLKDAEDILITEGTESHTKNMEHAIGKMLKAEGLNVRAPKGRGAWDTLKFMANETLVSVEHHVSTSMRSYLEASTMSITMGDMRNRCARAGKEVPKCFVRSHRHQFGTFSDGYGSITILPPWQASTRFVHKVVPGAIPQCGLVVLDFRDEPNAPPVVHSRLYTINA